MKRKLSGYQRLVLKYKLKRWVKNLYRNLCEYWGVYKVRRIFYYRKKDFIKASFYRKDGILKYKRLLYSIYLSGKLIKKEEKEKRRKLINEERSKLNKDINKLINKYYSNEIKKNEELKRDINYERMKIEERESIISDKLDRIREIKKLR